MGQYWQLINIDRRRILRLECLKLGEFLFWKDPQRLVGLLAIPRKPSPFDRAVVKEHSTDTKDLGALNLPSDILTLIFEEFQIDDLPAVVCLSLTNTYLRELGQKRLWDFMLVFHGAWWLERLICVGDYLDGDDLPPHILRGEEEEKTLTGNHIDDDERHGSRLYDAFECNVYDENAVMYNWNRMYRDLAYMGLSKKERRLMKDMMEPDFSWDGRPETEWILCNWSTAEYVRASAVAELTGVRCRGPWTNPFLSLGHVLMTQICWSSDPSASMCYEGEITRGPWAGHYFGITTVDNLSQDENCINKQPWTDVTEKIMKEVLEIWRLDCPKRLAEHLRA